MDWVKKIKENENRALKLLYETYRVDIITWLEKTYSLDYESSADIFQQAVIIFYDKVIQNKLSEENGNIKTYLYGICKNKALEHIRYIKRDQTKKQNYLGNIKVEIKDQENDVKEKNIKIIQKILEKMGNPCKDILELFYYKSWDLEEICEKMDYKNANTAKNLKYRCLKRLQLLFFDHV